MRIQITIKELIDKGIWQKFCNLKGWNEWCISEGLANYDETIILTIEECKQLNLQIGG